MTVTPPRIALFLFGLFLAAGIIAYGSGAFQREQAQGSSTVAAVAPGQLSSNGTAVDGQSGPETRSPAASGTPQISEQEPQAQPIPSSAEAPNPVAEPVQTVKAPRFHLLRVEPNGSVVVAGQAAAGAAVEVVSGSTVLGNTVAGPTGDFAIVLDKPLGGGDYSLVLRETNNGSAATSMETAIVSVPKDNSGQVLAMVEQPGEPSRLITVPDAPADSGDAAADQQGSTNPVADTAAPAKPAEPSTGAGAQSKQAESGGQQIATAPSASAEAPDQISPAPSDPSGAQPKQGESGGQQIAAAPSASAEAPVQISPAPSDPSGAQPKQGESDGQQIAAAPSGGADAPVETSPALSDPSGAQPNQAESGSQQIAVAPSAGAEASVQTSPASSEPSVTQPANPASDAAAGPASSAPTGANPIEEEGTNDLAASQEAAPAQSERVTQPAESRVAAADPAPATNNAPAARNPVQAPAVEAVEIEGGMVYIAGRAAPGSTLRVYANDLFLGQVIASPEGRFLVEAQQDLPVGSYTIRIDAIGADGKTVVARAAVPFEREAGEAVAAVAPPPAEPQAAPVPGSSVEQPRPERPATMDEPTVADRSAAPGLGKPAVADQPAAPGIVVPVPAASSSAASAQIPGQQPASMSPTEATAPALQSAKGAVIIRRGDTLWRISRRAYGRGVRYSTIYLANQDQIRDPDRIYPGQVFAMPEATPDGHKLDMSQLGEQAVERD